jgi:hypothetical protein
MDACGGPSNEEHDHDVNTRAAHAAGMMPSGVGNGEPGVTDASAGVGVAQRRGELLRRGNARAESTHAKRPALIMLGWCVCVCVCV